MFEKTFKILGLSQKSHKIFLLLLERGPSTARQIAATLDLPTPSVYDHLDILKSRNIVSGIKLDGRTAFCVGDLSVLPHLLEQASEEAEREGKDVRNKIDSLPKNSGIFEPSVKFFSGAEGVRQALNTILLSGPGVSLSVWPITDIVKIIGKEYFLEIDKKRIKKNIYVKGIWPFKKGTRPNRNIFLGKGKMLREVRMAPQKLKWHMGYWLLKDRAIFISSKQEMFSFVVQSAEFTELLRSQFELVWQISKTIAKD